MTTSLLIIIIAIITLLSVIVILNLILPKTELSKGVIINKHTEPKHKINHVQIIGEIPVCYDETTPSKYYLDISGYDHDNKTQTITITVSEETYNQYSIGDTWQSSTNEE